MESNHQFTISYLSFNHHFSHLWWFNDRYQGTTIRDSWPLFSHTCVLQIPGLMEHGLSITWRRAPVRGSRRRAAGCRLCPWRSKRLGAAPRSMAHDAGSHRARNPRYNRQKMLEIYQLLPGLTDGSWWLFDWIIWVHEPVWSTQNGEYRTSNLCYCPLMVLLVAIVETIALSHKNC